MTTGTEVFKIQLAIMARLAPAIHVFLVAVQTERRG